LEWESQNSVWVRGDERWDCFECVHANSLVLITQCFDEYGNRAGVVYRAENLHSKGALVIGFPYSIFALKYPDERFDGAFITEFLQCFYGGACNVDISKASNERVYDSLFAECAERVDGGFTQFDILLFVFQYPNEWFYRFRVAYASERASDFGAGKV